MIEERRDLMESGRQGRNGDWYAETKGGQEMCSAGQKTGKEKHNCRKERDMMEAKLKDCVSGICMKEEMKKAVIENVKERTEGAERACGETGKDSGRKSGTKGHVAV